jgi:uncharacterized protein involved in exopolysaccharide biosynthesis
MTPLFRGQAVLVAANADRSMLGGSSLGSSLGGSVGALAGLAGINLSGRDEEIEEALAVMHSRQFTEKFITDNNLMPDLFAKQWDAAAGRWKVPPDRQPTLNKGFKALDGLRTLDRDTKTGLITLKLDWHDRVRAADLANRMVDQLNSEMRARAGRAAEDSLGFLEKELATTREVGTREAISRLIETQVRQRMFANVTQEYSLRFVDRALVPDPTDKVSPRKALMTIAGMMLGVVLGMTWAVCANLYQIMRRRGT